MSAERRDEGFGRLVALPLRYGTVVAVIVIAIGLVAGFGEPVELGVRRPVPLLEAVGSGGALGVVSIGLLVLSLVPLVMAITALIGFARRREERYLGATALVCALLVASLLVPVLIYR